MKILLIVVLIVLLVIYFRATKMLKLPLEKDQEKKWRFIRIACTGVTLLILVYIFKAFGIG